MKTYLEISVSATQEQRELLLPTMIELGCHGFQETDTHLLCYIDKSRWDEEKYASLQEEMKKILQTISANAEIVLKEIEEQNWNEQWEQTLQPIEVGERLVITPTWTPYENTSGRMIIRIDPKMSFGTGYHETTRLTLQLLEKYLRPGMTVLDVGTGTGILAIAAVKLGASSAVGIDNDEWSIDNARENIGINNVQESVEIGATPLEEIATPFDLITANLTLNTNSELLPHFRRLLPNNGILLLSGLLNYDREAMLTRLAEEHFAVTELIQENEWIAICAGKQA